MQASDRTTAAFLALAVHGAFFGVGSLGLLRQAEFGIDAFKGAAEVDLIAAPAPDVEAGSKATVAPAAARETPAPVDEQDVAEPTKADAAPVTPAVTAVPNALLTTKDLSGPLGDGSSPVPGTDATTMHRAGSSGSYYKPGYFRNPAPPYPEEARRLKQQGLTLLEVRVNPEGRVAEARIRQSSGFPLLDQAALKGVQSWKFKPATLGGIRVENLVLVPIRFQLK